MNGAENASRAQLLFDQLHNHISSDNKRATIICQNQQINPSFNKEGISIHKLKVIVVSLSLSDQKNHIIIHVVVVPYAIILHGRYDGQQ